MELVLIGLGIGFLWELFLFIPFVWKRYYLQVLVCLVAIPCTVFASTLLLLSTINIASICVTIVSLYRIINLLRIVEGRMNVRYMYNATLRTCVSLVALQIFTLLAWWAVETFMTSENSWLSIIAAAQVSAGVILLASTIRRLKHTKLAPDDIVLTTSELPSVTIAIPARNETDDLYECLISLIKNDYPKLEILVLDDCSQLRRTPEIIREFAHAGVRFVKGDTPKENWLAKNQAYDKLLREASGEIILFCGVDVRFEPDTIRQIVATMISRNKRMVSVTPLRWQAEDFQYSIVQAGRYFWELAPPRRLFRRPPVLSTCWAIYRKDALALGGFGAVSRSIIPEAYFAKQMLHKDGYSFLRADKRLSLFSAKSYSAQRNTAVRVRYPQLHRRPEIVLFVTFIGLICFVAPYLSILLGALGVISSYFIFFAALSIALCNAAYALIAISTGVNSWYIAPFYFLLVVLSDIVLTHYSLYKYEFSEVVWKGRNICIPVMHVIPRLPKV